MEKCKRSIAKSFICFVVIFLVTTSARPSNLDDSQVDQDSFDRMEPLQFKALQMALLAQRLAELNQVEKEIGPMGAESFERSFRSETGRNRRYRSCYFNPISCFK